MRRVAADFYCKQSWNFSTRNMKPQLILSQKNTNDSMHLCYLGQISYEVRWEMKRLVHCYAIMPFQLQFIHETNKLKKYFTYKDKKDSSSLFKHSLQTNMHVWVKLHWADLPKFYNPIEWTQIWTTFKSANICWPNPPTVLTSSNRKYLEASSVKIKFTCSSLFWYRNINQISISVVHLPSDSQTFISRGPLSHLFIFAVSRILWINSRLATPEQNASLLLMRLSPQQVQWNLCSCQHSPTNRTYRLWYLWLDFGQMVVEHPLRFNILVWFSRNLKSQPHADTEPSS